MKGILSSILISVGLSLIVGIIAGRQSKTEKYYFVTPENQKEKYPKSHISKLFNMKLKM